ncbi:VOC family protein [Arcicella rigui]|uniref:VOC family protein n=1 Tax=Arcicella rigui TaxID=797020 RepID=A0ABU5QG33_9BACT|nr:VOC family protein [Arcicella rigui]MEA5141587.1 VOC family protein [Arcicella rigui]
MKTSDFIKGIHHVTATVNDAQADYQFYTHTLGMRLIKKTVNFDNHNVYHFYYGDQVGTPSTIFTTFPYKGQPNVKQGEEGTGLIIATALSVPASALPFWEKRLTEQGTSVLHGKRFGQSYLWFRDPSGLQIELIGDDTDTRKTWISPDETEITEAVGVKGIHHVTLSIAPEHWELMLDFLQAEMNMTIAAQENNRVRLNVNGGGAGMYLEMRLDENTAHGRNGIGTVHHVAWIVEDDAALMAMRERMIEKGFVPTDMKDRKYFHSVYFRPYAGMWFEMATLAPGFTVDEAEEELGEHLLLPEWEEVNRKEIEANLPKIG